MLGDVRLGGAVQERDSPSGNAVAVGRSVFRYSSSAGGELVAELRVRRSAHPAGASAEDVVQVAGLGQLGGLDRAA